MSDGEAFKVSCGLLASMLLSELVLLGFVVPELSGVELLFLSFSRLAILSPDSRRPGCGDAELQELGLTVRGVLGRQVALGTRNPDLSPLDSFLSEDLEYGLKLDLSSTPMSLIFSGLDLESLSEVIVESLAEESDFPI